MTSETDVVINEIASHAAQQGWEPIVRACADLRCSSNRRLQLAFAEGVHRTAFETWVRALDNEIEVSDVGLSDLLVSPEAELIGGKLVAVFSAANFPTAMDMEAFNKIVAPLAMSTRCIVLLVEDDEGSVDDLNASHKMAWGLFVPEPKPIWSGQALASEGIHFWTINEDEQAKARIALRRALERQQSPEEEAERTTRMADHLIELISARLRMGRSIHAGTIAAPPADWRAGDVEDAMRARLHETMEELACDRRMIVQATAMSLRTELGTATPRTDGSEKATEFAQRTVSAGLEKLRLELSGVAKTAAEVWSDYVNRILSGIPWSMFNTPKGLDQQAISADLALTVVPEPEIFMISEPVVSSGPSIPGGPKPVVILGGAVVGLALGAKLGPVGLGVGAAVGAASGQMIAQRLNDNATRAQQERWRDAVSNWSQRAENKMSLQLNRLEVTLNDTIRQRLRALEALIDDARNRSAKPDFSDAEFARLEAWRKRLHPGV
jgi:hypothetical protein